MKVKAGYIIEELFDGFTFIRTVSVYMEDYYSQIFIGPDNANYLYKFKIERIENGIPIGHPILIPQ